MKRIAIACLLLCAGSSVSAAAVPAPMNVTSPYQFYLGAGAGEFFARSDGDNHVGTGAGWPPDHYVTRNISDQPFFYLAGGYRFARNTVWLPYYSLGLRYSYISSATMSGYVDQFSLPAFRNYHFKYDVQLLTLLATFKLDIYRWHNLMPYVSGGLGFANYSTSDFTEQALSGVTPRLSPGFAAGNGNNLSYNLGIGVDYVVCDNIWVNLEYNYSDFGTAKSGGGADYTTLTGTNYAGESLKNRISGAALLAGVTLYIG